MPDLSMSQLAALLFSQKLMGVGPLAQSPGSTITRPSDNDFGGLQQTRLGGPETPINPAHVHPQSVADTPAYPTVDPGPDGTQTYTGTQTYAEQRHSSPPGTQTYTGTQTYAEQRKNNTPMQQSGGGNGRARAI